MPIGWQSLRVSICPVTYHQGLYWRITHFVLPSSSAMVLDILLCRSQWAGISPICLWACTPQLYHRTCDYPCGWSSGSISLIGRIPKEIVPEITPVLDAVCASQLGPSSVPHSYQHTTHSGDFFCQDSSVPNPISHTEQWMTQWSPTLPTAQLVFTYTSANWSLVRDPQ